MPRRSSVGPRAASARDDARRPVALAEPAGEARNSTVDRALRVLEAFLGEDARSACWSCPASWSWTRASSTGS